MYHALTTDSKQQADFANNKPPLQKQDAHRTFDGSHSWRSMSSGRGFASVASISPRNQNQKLMRLQKAYGNQVVLRMLERSKPAMQPKLVVNEPGDAYEQEADRVAEQVMRMPDPKPSVASAPEQLSRKCPACEEEDKKKLQRKPVGTPDPAGLEAPPIVHEVLRSPGEPLDPATRAFFEPRFGYDFSNVRVHADEKAAESARAVNALAYTVSNHIVFAPRQYKLSTTAGEQLLAHELTHVVQQNGALSSLIIRGNDLPAVVQRQSPQSQSNGDKIIPPVPCDLATTSPGGLQETVRFPNDVSELNGLQKDQIDNFVRNWWVQGANTPVRVDGYASKRGPTDHNWALSCRRAISVVAELKTPLDPRLAGIPESFIKIFMHGETTEFSSSEAENRRATISADFPPTAPSCPPCPEDPRTPGCPLCPPVPAVCGSKKNPDHSSVGDNPHLGKETEGLLKVLIASDCLLPFPTGMCEDGEEAQHVWKEAFAKADSLLDAPPMDMCGPPTPGGSHWPGSPKLPGKINGPDDAFRHCFGSCILASRTSPSWAERVGTDHENSEDPHRLDGQMDLHNNFMGRSFSKPHDDSGCENSCLEALRSGELRTVRVKAPSCNEFICLGPSDQPWP